MVSQHQVSQGVSSCSTLGIANCFLQSEDVCPENGLGEVRLREVFSPDQEN